MKHRESPPKATIYILENAAADIDMVLPNGEVKRGYCGRVEQEGNHFKLTIIIDEEIK